MASRLLEIQGYACAMCYEPFEAGQPIFIDHDHACCPGEKRSCGRCVRGLLDLSCNTALGVIERKYAMARAYLDNLPAWSGRLTIPRAVGAAGARLPDTEKVSGSNPLRPTQEPNAQSITSAALLGTGFIIR